jgi:myo-inositol catabolism protein IolC
MRGQYQIRLVQNNVIQLDVCTIKSRMTMLINVIKSSATQQHGVTYVVAVVRMFHINVPMEPHNLVAAMIQSNGLQKSIQSHVPPVVTFGHVD